MSPLSQKIDAAVDAAGGPGVVTVSEGPRLLSLQLTAASPVGAAFDALELSVTGGESRLSTAALKTWGDRLAARLTYLMEPLVVIEVDEVGGEVTLRSHAPGERNTVFSYYELQLKSEGSLHLRRVAFDVADRVRRSASCQLTREALERLVDDIQAALP
jgi:hypothetical protein